MIHAQLSFCVVVEQELEIPRLNFPRLGESGRGRKVLFETLHFFQSKREGEICDLFDEAVDFFWSFEHRFFEIHLSVVLVAKELSECVTFANDGLEHFRIGVGTAALISFIQLFPGLGYGALFEEGFVVNGVKVNDKVLSIF